MNTLETLAARRALLAARSDLERIDLAAAARGLATAVRPSQEPGHLGILHPLLARVIRLAIPIFGATRLGTLGRALSIGLVAFRLLRAWRTPRRPAA
jgi:hypothetical protein